MLARRRGPFIALAAAILICAAAAAVVATRPPDHATRAPAANRPTLLLLTSLPLIFGEDFSLRAPGSPALQALSAHYKVVPVSTSAPSELAKGRLLLMAQPGAQTPENLVALDDWVRAGGRLLLLADPLLEWPSARPLGDPLRPLPTFVDIGLLGHWGVRLMAPEQRGFERRLLAGHDVTTVSPGTLFGACKISVDRLVADCRIGRGRTLIVADADLLNAGGTHAPANLDAVTAALADLAQK